MGILSCLYTHFLTSNFCNMVHGFPWLHVCLFTFYIKLKNSQPLEEFGWTSFRLEIMLKRPFGFLEGFGRKQLNGVTRFGQKEMWWRNSFLTNMTTNWLETSTNSRILDWNSGSFWICYYLTTKCFLKVPSFICSTNKSFFLDRVHSHAQ